MKRKENKSSPLSLILIKEAILFIDMKESYQED